MTSIHPSTFVGRLREERNRVINHADRMWKVGNLELADSLRREARIYDTIIEAARAAADPASRTMMDMADAMPNETEEESE